jgi:cell division protein FtsI/penicillin-binding protein 2
MKKPIRIYLSGVGLILFAVAIIVKLVSIQTNPKFIEVGNQIGTQSSTKEKEFLPVRGLIYDRWGNVLAGNSEVFEIGVELNQVSEKNRADLVTFLSSVTGKSRTEIEGRVNIEYNTDPEKGKPAVYSVVMQNAPQEIIDEIDRAQQDNTKLDAITWTSSLKRTYPEKSLGVNFLGYHADAGYFGVEGYYNNVLASAPSMSIITYNPYETLDITEIPHGAGIILTIDREIQSRMEEIMDRAIANNGAASGTAIIMDPETGEILAMTTTPRGDPNLPAGQFFSEYPIVNENGTDIGTPLNRAIMQTYEPGSVFKVFTMAAALDSGTVTPDTEFLDTGYIEVGGLPVHNWDYGAWGLQNMTGCMQHSLNVCMAWLAKEMGANNFYSYLQAFNLDRKTNVDMEGEAIYPLLSPSNPTPFGSSEYAPRWVEANMGAQSFGQAIAVTPIRMITSVAALANDGRMMAPHILKATVQDGRIRYYTPKILATPVKPETARTLTEMLAVSLEGESSTALVEGYRLAGKTGTAEIPTQFGYTSDLTNASFVGWGPVDDPKFIVYIWLEKPTSDIWSSIVVAPVFSEIVENLVILMDIPPDNIRMQMANQ